MRSRHLALGMITALALTLPACSTAETTSDTATPASAEASFFQRAAETTPGNDTFLEPGDVDRTDLEDVAKSTAIIATSWDTLTDTTETAALLRAKPLMSESYADQLAEPERNSSQQDWLAAAEHEAYSAPVAAPAPTDAAAHDYGEDRAVRAYIVTWKWQGRDGKILEGQERRSVTVYLEKHNDEWDVVGFQNQTLL